MKLAFFAGECSPFAASGGLGEVIASLPKALTFRGHDCIVAMPLYRHVRDSGVSLGRPETTLQIPMGNQDMEAEVFFTEWNGLHFIFIGREDFYDRSFLYGPPGSEYDDNLARFVLYQKAALDAIRILNFEAEILHAHDWHAGLIPLFSMHGPRGGGEPYCGRTVFTIHNLAYQGVYPGTQFPLTNLPPCVLGTEGCLESQGKLSFMKGGILAADRVTTVSKTYAKEIMSEEKGHGLADVLRSRASQVTGITNGIDNEEWNPAKDPQLAEKYSSDAVTPGKATCRKALAAEFGWTGIPYGRAFFGMIGRVVEMKGIDLLDQTMERFLSRNVCLIIVGSGEEKYENMCQAWAERWPDQIKWTMRYEPDLARRVYAGVDFSLMPSREEPCGLSQLYSMRYGTGPVVHATGGLVDTVIDYSSNPQNGTGFTFQNFSGDCYLEAIDRALDLFSIPDDFQIFRKRLMDTDNSWLKTAQEYEHLYKSLLN